MKVGERKLRRLGVREWDRHLPRSAWDTALCVNTPAIGSQLHSWGHFPASVCLGKTVVPAPGLESLAPRRRPGLVLWREAVKGRSLSLCLSDLISLSS